MKLRKYKDLRDKIIQQAFLKYRENAKDRALEFALERLDIEGFIDAPCHYCGRLPEPISAGKYYYLKGLNGLDRIRNDEGYTLDNVVSCCFSCNRMKSTRSYWEFLTQCAIIAAYPHILPETSKKWR